MLISTVTRNHIPYTTKSIMQSGGSIDHADANTPKPRLLASYLNLITFPFLAYPHLLPSPLLVMDYAYDLLDKGYVPDVALRPVIRQLCRKRLREINHGKSHRPSHHEVEISTLKLDARLVGEESRCKDGFHPRSSQSTYRNRAKEGE